MISHEKKFLFLHVPKTAGNSVQNIIHTYSGDEIIAKASFQDGKERFQVKNQNHPSLHKHSTMQDYLKAFGRSILQYYIFSTIRNPWDKVVSFYFSPHRGSVDFNFAEFEKFAESVPPVEVYLARSRLNRAIFTRRHISRLMRFEHLEEDFGEVCEDLGLETSPLPTRNKSMRLPYRECYSKSLADRIGQKHRNEIRLGAYRF